MSDLLQVTVWNENRQKKDPNVVKGKIFYFRPGHETYPIFLNTLFEIITPSTASS